jgi:hypothetical protein
MLQNTKHEDRRPIEIKPAEDTLVEWDTLHAAP